MKVESETDYAKMARHFPARCSVGVATLPESVAMSSE
jgi:hypothetical protein